MVYLNTGNSVYIKSQRGGVASPVSVSGEEGSAGRASRRVRGSRAHRAVTPRPAGPPPVQSAAPPETSGHSREGCGVTGASLCPAASGPQVRGLAGLLLSGTGQVVHHQPRCPAWHRAAAEGLPPASAQPTQGRCLEQRRPCGWGCWQGEDHMRCPQWRTHSSPVC